MVLGEVKSVSDSEITIAVGTMKEMGHLVEMDRMAEHRMEMARAGDAPMADGMRGAGETGR